MQHTFSSTRRVALALSGLLLGLSMIASRPAHASIWLCVDPESGAKTITDNPRGAGKCRRHDIPGTTATPAPSGTATRSAARTPSTPAAASPETRARESDRKQILTDELTSENRRLSELRREFNLGSPIRRPEETDDARYQERKSRLSAEIERSKSNVRALERELGRP